MLKILIVQTCRIIKYRHGFFERHAVLLEVAEGLPSVPREHISVYTLSQGFCQAAGFEAAFEPRARAALA